MIRKEFVTGRHLRVARAPQANMLMVTDQSGKNSDRTTLYVETEDIDDLCEALRLAKPEAGRDD